MTRAEKFRHFIHRALSLATIHEQIIPLPHSAVSTPMKLLGCRRFRNAEKVERAACELLQTQQSDFYLEGVFQSCPVRINPTNLLWNYFKNNYDSVD
jgi:hypothetical protein